MCEVTICIKYRDRCPVKAADMWWARKQTVARMLKPGHWQIAAGHMAEAGDDTLLRSFRCKDYGEQLPLV